MLSFTFGGKNSYTDYEIVISQRASIPSPLRRVTTLEVPGRNSALRFDENTYEDITITVECSLKDNTSLADKVDLIKGWLIGAGESDLVFDFQPNKKYIAQVVNAINFVQAYKIFSKFIIIFNCRPFKFAVSNSAITLNTSGSITNIGTVYSEPIIKVYGTGDATLAIGSQVNKLTGISSSIIIDSTIQDCYAVDGSNMNNKMSGDFPVINIGANAVSWIGNVVKVEIIPNWRWL
ncbi:MULTISPECIES: distal tail protein Dit [Clostridium]|uniref:Distal tail protein Dit n=1 Tax=Clostridium frigoriphilum TaxID=443253 RepID=A0ABU7UQ11_9CLOT|nr:distal tail protein Dit [Clostridium sp. DSM 17811]MBU3100659.1 phage tail family protein [Clostridium sp. DSM 17811]